MKPTILLLCAALALAAETKRINPPGLSPPNGYTHVVTTDGKKLVYLSGQVALNAKGELVGKDDLRQQTTQVFENLKAALAAGGASFSSVVKLNWYIANYKPSDLPVIREIRNKYIDPANIPASTLIGVASLARDGWLIEVEAIAEVVR